jgi:hypothetical protein
MNEIRDRVILRLKNDGTLYPSLVPGGIYDRKLQTVGPGSTDEAFYTLPGDPTKRIRLHPCIVIFGPNDVEPADGAVVTGGIRTRWGFLRLFVYVEATAAGKQRYDEIASRVRYDLEGWQAQLSTGYPATVEEVDVTELTDSDEFNGSLVSLLRYRVEWSRSAP